MVHGSNTPTESDGISQGNPTPELGILSHTTIRVPPEGFENYTPYVVAIIKLDEGATISGQVIGNPSEIATGNKVRPVFRKMQEDGSSGLIQYGIKFEITDFAGVQPD